MDLNNRNRLGSVRLSMHGRDPTSRKDTRNPNHDHPSVNRRSGFHHPTYPHTGPHTRGGAAHNHRTEPAGAPRSGAQYPNLEPKLRYSEIGKHVKPFKGLTKRLMKLRISALGEATDEGVDMPMSYSGPSRPRLCLEIPRLTSPHSNETPTLIFTVSTAAQTEQLRGSA